MKNSLESLCNEYLDFFSRDDYFLKIKENPSAGAEIILKIESFLVRALQSQQRDVDILLQLAICQLLTPLEDFESSINYCHRILDIDDTRNEPKLLLGFIYDYHFGVISEEIIHLINEIDSKDKLIRSAKYYFQSKDPTLHDEALRLTKLLDSIEEYECNILAISQLNSLEKVKDVSSKQDIKACVESYYKSKAINSGSANILSFDIYLKEKIMGLGYFVGKK